MGKLIGDKAADQIGELVQDKSIEIDPSDIPEKQQDFLSEIILVKITKKKERGYYEGKEVNILKHKSKDAFAKIEFKKELELRELNNVDDSNLVGKVFWAFPVGREDEELKTQWVFFCCKESGSGIPYTPIGDPVDPYVPTTDPYEGGGDGKDGKEDDTGQITFTLTSAGAGQDDYDNAGDLASIELNQSTKFFLPDGTITNLYNGTDKVIYYAFDNGNNQLPINGTGDPTALFFKADIGAIAGGNFGNEGSLFVDASCILDGSNIFIKAVLIQNIQLNQLEDVQSDTPFFDADINSGNPIESATSFQTKLKIKDNSGEYTRINSKGYFVQFSYKWISEVGFDAKPFQDTGNTEIVSLGGGESGIDESNNISIANEHQGERLYLSAEVFKGVCNTGIIFTIEVDTEAPDYTLVITADQSEYKVGDIMTLESRNLLSAADTSDFFGQAEEFKMRWVLEFSGVPLAFEVVGQVGFFTFFEESVEQYTPGRFGSKIQIIIPDDPAIVLAGKFKIFSNLDGLVTTLEIDVLDAAPRITVFPSNYTEGETNDITVDIEDKSATLTADLDTELVTLSARWLDTNQTVNINGNATISDVVSVNTVVFEDVVFDVDRSGTLILKAVCPGLEAIFEEVNIVVTNDPNFQTFSDDFNKGLPLADFDGGSESSTNVNSTPFTQKYTVVDSPSTSLINNNKYETSITGGVTDNSDHGIKVAVKLGKVWKIVVAFEALVTTLMVPPSNSGVKLRLTGGGKDVSIGRANDTDGSGESVVFETNDGDFDRPSNSETTGTFTIETTQDNKIKLTFSGSATESFTYDRIYDIDTVHLVMRKNPSGAITEVIWSALKIFALDKDGALVPVVLPDPDKWQEIIGNGRAMLVNNKLQLIAPEGNTTLKLESKAPTFTGSSRTVKVKYESLEVDATKEKMGIEFTTAADTYQIGQQFDGSQEIYVNDTGVDTSASSSSANSGELSAELLAGDILFKNDTELIDTITDGADWLKERLILDTNVASKISQVYEDFRIESPTGNQT